MKQCFCYHSTNLLGNYSWMIAFEELTTSRTFFMTRTGLISIFGWQHYRLGTNTPSQRIAKNVVAHNHRCGKCYSMTSLGQQAPYQFTQELRKKNLMWMQGVQLPSSLPFPWLCQSVRVESKHIKVIKGPVNRPQPFFLHLPDKLTHTFRRPWQSHFANIAALHAMQAPHFQKQFCTHFLHQFSPLLMRSDNLAHGHLYVALSSLIGRLRYRTAPWPFQ